MRFVPLVHHDCTVAHIIVDDDDYAWAMRYTWHPDGKGYAERRTPRPDPRKVSMSRELLGLAPGDKRIGDHINRNKLDNRHSNLRILTKALNNHNLPSYITSKWSQHRGVSFRPDRNKWRAYGSLGGKWHHLGHFDTEEDAALAARTWRLSNMEAAVD